MNMNYFNTNYHLQRNKSALMIHATMPAKTFNCSLFNSTAINLHTKIHIYTDCDENITFLAEVRTAGNLTKPGLIWLNITYTG